MIEDKDTELHIDRETLLQEYIPRKEYEQRLKADVVAMLTEIQMEIEEIKIDLPFGFEPVSKTSAFYEGVSASSRLIQEKINEIEGHEDGLNEKTSN